MSTEKEQVKKAPQPQKSKTPRKTKGKIVQPVLETGGPKGLEPTRYGDWEKGGRCSDF